MNTLFSASSRTERLQSMAEQTFDLIVIGGGITGAGIALDAQTRGMKTALVEMQDFASGTSSRSTKLVHGGLRYLKQLEIGVVAEVGKERAIVYENGPHITTPVRMLLPIYKAGTFGRFSSSIGLAVYDFLAGVKKDERRKMLSREDTVRKEPLLKKDGLLGGGYYVEYRTDDARLTIEVMKKAAEKGALAVNYTKVTSFIYKEGQIAGVTVEDQVSGQEYRIHAKAVVNAAGPWVDTLREMDGSKKGKTLHLTKGVHLVFDGARFPLHQAVYFDTPDGRMVFAIPRDGKTYVGTTDTNYNADKASPRMTEEDRRYLLDAVNPMFPDVRLTAEDVESSWAGLRPLIHEEGKKPSEISRKDEIFHSETGLISIGGGKLTGYRKMAETVVDRVANVLGGEGLKFGACLTRNMPLSGGDVGGSASFAAFIDRSAVEGRRAGLPESVAVELARKYGANAPHIYEAAARSMEATKLNEMPIELYAELIFAMEEEMTVTPSDFFVRRTGMLFFDISGVRDWKDEVISVMAEKLNWTAEIRERYEAELDSEIAAATIPYRG
ncbi:glycerol-3-phosphate dehydrogenase/oxidase [Cohnella silvisoli]|uniref:Glycerol-3-phosphate dehydrogenase n=1 Tax=Cohnella silvisoli TaxID=2873699 RepID=A0ABV1L4C0_9BACL|nr:glycerol-3-phosphate dehydrogenase/oxidase [Cohnella silvisoli]MCD9026512.1 glycerol-3-phosphate dehydrogenase/oxidase [Cohnella silvisoli]